jgi:dephospho-CoA kinase
VSRWPNKYVIGLTGNIAVGKSVVRQMLQHLGAYTIDADGLSHQAMQPGAPAYRPIIETFGQFILDQDKRINRAMLGNIVFSSPDALAKLEAIIHPVVGQAVNTLVSRARQRVVVIEAIKLLEGDLANAVDSVWVVHASPQTQYLRLIQKRKMTEAEAKQRILAQTPQKDKLAKAHVVIRNDGNVEETWHQVQAEWNRIREKLTASAPAEPEAPTAPAAPAAPTDATMPRFQVEVKRGMPGNAEAIAQFITSVTSKEITRMDIMLAFGQKSYILAQAGEDRTIGLMGWQVENLITRADELYLAQGVPPGPVIAALVNAIEESSKALQSEVGYIFLPPDTRPEVIQAFVSSGYETTTITDIKIPAWREAVQEVMSSDSQYQILTKKLREDRVLQPL